MGSYLEYDRNYLLPEEASPLEKTIEMIKPKTKRAATQDQDRRTERWGRGRNCLRTNPAGSESVGLSAMNETLATPSYLCLSVEAAQKETS